MGQELLAHARTSGLDFPPGFPARISYPDLPTQSEPQTKANPSAA
jgi:hypothetical protein